MTIDPLYRDPRRRAELLALFGTAFGTLPRKIDLAGALGFHWEPVTTPFVSLHEDRVASHVGVLDVPLRVAGRSVRAAGIHAVCTLPELRRRGLYRQAMERALAFVDERWDRAQLYTAQPELYEPFGFRVIPTTRWQAARPSGAPATIARPVGVDDLPELRAALSRRTPVSHVYAAMDDGWLLGIDAVLATADLSRLWRIPALELFVAGKLEDGCFSLYDVIGPTLPSWRTLVPHLPGQGPVHLAFTPDRYADADPRSQGPADDGYFMVRGPFEPEGQPLAIPPLAQH